MRSQAPGSSVFSWTLKTWAPRSMTILKRSTMNPESLSTIHAVAFFLSTTGAAWIPGVYLKVAGDVLFSCIPEEGQTLRRLAFIEGSCLANKNISGLAHTQPVVSGPYRHWLKGTVDMPLWIETQSGHYRCPSCT